MPHQRWERATQSRVGIVQRQPLPVARGPSLRPRQLLQLPLARSRWRVGARGLRGARQTAGNSYVSDGHSSFWVCGSRAPDKIVILGSKHFYSLQWVFGLGANHCQPAA